jgi:hypothetical protein
MQAFTLAIVTALPLVALGCGATTRTTAGVQEPVLRSLSSTTVLFISREQGSGEKSALRMQLLRPNAQVIGELNATGIKFDDNSSSGPFVVSLTGAFTMSDVNDGRVRIRLVPDGRDWKFDVHMTMRFSDDTSRNFTWRGVRLDNDDPERVLALAPAEVR